MTTETANQRRRLNLFCALGAGLLFNWWSYCWSDRNRT